MLLYSLYLHFQFWQLQHLEYFYVWIVCSVSCILFVFIGLSFKINFTRVMDFCLLLSVSRAELCKMWVNLDLLSIIEYLFYKLSVSNNDNIENYESKIHSNEKYQIWIGLNYGLGEWKVRNKWNFYCWFIINKSGVSYYARFWFRQGCIPSSYIYHYSRLLKPSSKI